MRNKFLLIGSAPYIEQWYMKYGKKVLTEGFKLCAMNNAWVVDATNLYLWMYPCDFFDTGHLIPDKKIRKWKGYKSDHRIPTKPYDYDKGKDSGTMMLNALVHLLNISIGIGCDILVAGSDCVYKGKSHFYGKGSSDPLRQGEHYLMREFNRIHKFYIDEGCRVYNVGRQKDSMLPFPSMNVNDALVKSKRVYGT